VATPRDPKTRLAPSPTGALHLGNARSFLIAWAMARRQGWRIVLRIEDLDSPRTKQGADRDAIDTLAWLGIDWDIGPVYQSHDLAPYIDAMRTLAERGCIFPSALSRTEIESGASAPHPDEPGHEVRFPPELRPASFPEAFDPALGVGWRFATPAGPVAFQDLVMGAQAIDPGATIGDFIVWTRGSTPAYQLAVVVDDHRQGITHIVRGNDLVDSAARQLLLYRALRLGPEPFHCHLPLIRGADGRRLAKRHGDTRVAHYRARGVPPERVIGYLAWSAGVVPTPTAMTASEFAERFGLDTMPRTDWTFLPEHDRWIFGT
jgi:glutamyl-tRNA synthetase